MAQSWGGQIEVKGFGVLSNPLDLSTPVDRLSIGSSNFAAIAANIATSSGTGSGAANEQWHDQRTLLTTATDSLDLAGTALTNGVGVALALTKIKAIVIAIVAPDGTKTLNVGPNATANAFAAFWGAGTVNIYNVVRDFMCIADFYTGYTVTAGTGDLLIINNPSAVTVVYNIWLVGTK